MDARALHLYHPGADVSCSGCGRFVPDVHAGSIEDAHNGRGVCSACASRGVEVDVVVEALDAEEAPVEPEETPALPIEATAEAAADTDEGDEEEGDEDAGSSPVPETPVAPAAPAEPAEAPKRLRRKKDS